MKSPFPGMDPYIEASRLWGDFHTRLIALMADSLGQAAPDHYLVRTDERSYMVLVGPEGKESRPFLPDVGVTTSRKPKKTARRSGVAVAEPAGDVAPVTMRAFIEDEHRESFVEIYESEPELRLVTSIEVLSPSNKRHNTPGWDLYLRKRQSLLLDHVNLVEIDLLRGGSRMPMLDPWPDSPYTLLVSMSKLTRNCQVWPAHFRRPLPAIPVPLVKPDPPLSLDLQPMIEQIYKRSRYGRSIDYTQPLTPPLSEEDAAWLRRQLGSRSGSR